MMAQKITRIRDCKNMWVKRVLKAWARNIEPILNLRREDSVDAGDEL